MTRTSGSQRNRAHIIHKPLSFKQFKIMKESKFKYEKQRYLETLNQKYLRKITDISRKGAHYFLRDAWEIFEQSNLRGRKAFVIERFIRISTSGNLHYKVSSKIAEVRIAYFIVTPKNRWWFGESSPFVPQEDIQKLSKALIRLRNKKFSIK